MYIHMSKLNSFFLFLMGLGYELRASCLDSFLKGKVSTVPRKLPFVPS
jgi:hypothetical protein